MTDAELRGKLLKVFYDCRHNAKGWVPVSDLTVSGGEAVSIQVIGSVCGQLQHSGLIEWKPLAGSEGIVAGMAKITPMGIDVIDGTRRSPISITATPVDMRKQPPVTEGDEGEYDVALSFAGEDRDYVDEVARSLRDRGVKVFYDLFEETSLWGKDLYTYLSDIYQHRARYTVMFISASYDRKLWTSHERRAAQARAFSEAQEYILPARFDGTEIPGVLPTTGYLTLWDKTPEELAVAIVQKLEGKEASIRASGAPRPTASQLKLEVGESAGFFQTGRAGSLWTHWRVLKLRISNTDQRRALTGCKVQIMKISPEEYSGPWILKEGFSLASGDHEFIGIAKYNEPDDIRKSPYGDSFFQILTPKNGPLPPANITHELSIRATALECPFVEIICKIWVDHEGRLRIASSGGDSAAHSE